jgi:LacI family transcriptional regulator
MTTSSRKNGMPNLRAVAEEAGVSLSTASRVLSNSASVSDDIRQRVVEASVRLGYQPRARKAVASLRRALLFVRSHNRVQLSAMLGDFYGYVLQGVEAECRRQRLTLSFGHDDGEAPIADQFGDLDVDDETGVLLVGPFNSDEVAAVQALDVPVVLINNVVDQVDAVLPDYYSGALLAVRHLLAAGHRQIAYLHGRDRYTTRLRLQGYADALREAGLPHDERLIAQSSMSPQGAHEAVGELLGRGVSFSALFCVNDISAYGAITALQTAGLRPGEDVSLVGFDGIDLSDLTRLRLTTVQVPKQELGAVAVRRLLDRAANPDGTPQRIVLAVRLLAGESVRQLG